MSFARYQHEIYAAGASGRRPRHPIALADLERAAEKVLRRPEWGYIAGSAGTEATERANRRALDDAHIVPRMLRDVSTRSLARSVLGLTLPAPILLAPIGVQTLAHPDGELASARAANSLDVPFVVSSASSFTIEDIAAAASDANRWFQLYWPRSRDLCVSFVQRAEAAGYQALVVTLDTWLLGWRPRDLSEAFLPFLWAEGNANYLHDPVFRAALHTPPEDDLAAAIHYFQRQFANPAITWDELAWLRSQTRLPIILKGIQHPDDARLAVAAGVDGIWVSNHGGRQVDGAIGSFTALGPIVEAVDRAVPIIFDSGIRTGSDIIKSLAVGADLVALGRPFVWGLAVGGESGVRDVLRGLLADLELTLGLSGYANIDELTPDSLARR